jgi:hypothetical protein
MNGDERLFMSLRPTVHEGMIPIDGGMVRPI